MQKVKFFYAETQVELEYKVNAFIADKAIVINSISYTMHPEVQYYRHCCCILYQ